VRAGMSVGWWWGWGRGAKAADRCWR
jgi:hypothetical protein